MKIQKYLPKNYEVPFVLDVFAIGKIGKTDASKVLAITKIYVELGLADLLHLKRIRKRQGDGQYVDILLARGEDTLNSQKIQVIFEGMVKQVWKEDLPVNAPCRKTQFNEWSKLWPINFVQPEIYKEVLHGKHEIQFLTHQNNIQQSQFVLFDQKLKILLRFPNFKGCQEGTIQHPIMKLLEEWPLSQGFKDTPNAYYLTKLRLISKISLCGMCAMALVHSRLERIYFNQQLDIQDIGEILCCQGLNHKVTIFRMFATANKN